MTVSAGGDTSSLAFEPDLASIKDRTEAAEGTVSSTLHSWGQVPQDTKHEVTRGLFDHLSGDDDHAGLGLWTHARVSDPDLNEDPQTLQSLGIEWASERDDAFPHLALEPAATSSASPAYWTAAEGSSIDGVSSLADDHEQLQKRMHRALSSHRHPGLAPRPPLYRFEPTYDVPSDYESLPGLLVALVRYRTKTWAKGMGGVIHCNGYNANNVVEAINSREIWRAVSTAPNLVVLSSPVNNYTVRLFKSARELLAMYTSRSLQLLRESLQDLHNWHWIFAVVTCNQNDERSVARGLRHPGWVTHVREWEGHWSVVLIKPPPAVSSGDAPPWKYVPVTRPVLHYQSAPPLRIGGGLHTEGSFALIRQPSQPRGRPKHRLEKLKGVASASSTPPRDRPDMPTKRYTFFEDSVKDASTGCRDLAELAKATTAFLGRWRDNMKPHIVCSTKDARAVANQLNEYGVWMVHASNDEFVELIRPQHPFAITYKSIIQGADHMQQLTKLLHSGPEEWNHATIACARGSLSDEEYDRQMGELKSRLEKGFREVEYKDGLFSIAVRLYRLPPECVLSPAGHCAAPIPSQGPQKAGKRRKGKNDAAETVRRLVRAHTSPASSLGSGSRTRESQATGSDVRLLPQSALPDRLEKRMEVGSSSSPAAYSDEDEEAYLPWPQTYTPPYTFLYEHGRESRFDTMEQVVQYVNKFRLMNTYNGQCSLQIACSGSDAEHVAKALRPANVWLAQADGYHRVNILKPVKPLTLRYEDQEKNMAFESVEEIREHISSFDNWGGCDDLYVLSSTTIDLEAVAKQLTSGPYYIAKPEKLAGIGPDVVHITKMNTTPPPPQVGGVGEAPSATLSL